MTLEEVLKQAGFNDAEIEAMDARVKGAYGNVVSVAEKERQEALRAKEEADLADRKMREWYTNEVTPAINGNYSKVAEAEARAEFYKKQAESAKESGFLPAEAPGYKPGEQPRKPDGTYTEVPGAPKYLTADQGYQAIVTTQNAVLEYSRLYPGKVMPDGIDVLGREARDQALPFDKYVAKKYDFEGRRKEIAAEESRKREEEVRKDERAKVEKQYAERAGSNPDLRIPSQSQFSAIRDPNEGKTAYPGSMNPRDRHTAVKKFIATRPVAA